MKKIASCFAIPLLLAACSSSPDKSAISEALDITPYLHPYRIDVRQGNMVTQEMVAQLKPGLTKDQVRFILGTPLLTDVFHADRWDYVYRLRTGSNGEVQQRRFVVFFGDGKLLRVGGDVIGEDPATAAAAPAKPAARIIEIKAPEPEGKPEEKKADAPAETSAASK
jgi:outer membrane protein assembly factor BamE